MPSETIVPSTGRRWQIESLFKQIKQTSLCVYFYGESANAIKIQIWVTLIANLLLSFTKHLAKRWSFSGLATIVRIVLMYYLNLEKVPKSADADLKSCSQRPRNPLLKIPKTAEGACQIKTAVHWIINSNFFLYIIFFIHLLCIYTLCVILYYIIC